LSHSYPFFPGVVLPSNTQHTHGFHSFCKGATTSVSQQANVSQQSQVYWRLL